MSPIHILAWIAIGILTLMTAAFLFGVVRVFYNAARAEYLIQKLHVATRDTPPAVGQLWQQQDAVLEITHVNADLVIVMCRGGGSTASWGDTHEHWKQRVYNRKLYLLN